MRWLSQELEGCCVNMRPDFLAEVCENETHGLLLLIASQVWCLERKVDTLGEYLGYVYHLEQGEEEPVPAALGERLARIEALLVGLTGKRE